MSKAILYPPKQHASGRQSRGMLRPRGRNRLAVVPIHHRAHRAILGTRSPCRQRTDRAINPFSARSSSTRKTRCQFAKPDGIGRFSISCCSSSCTGSASRFHRPQSSSHCRSRSQFHIAVQANCTRRTGSFHNGDTGTRV